VLQGILFPVTLAYVVDSPERAQIGKREAFEHFIGQTKCASRFDVIYVPFAIIGARHSGQELRLDVASQFVAVVAERADVTRKGAFQDMTNLPTECIGGSLCAPMRLKLAPLFGMPLAKTPPSSPALFPGS